MDKDASFNTEFQLLFGIYFFTFRCLTWFFSLLVSLYGMNNVLVFGRGEINGNCFWLSLAHRKGFTESENATCTSSWSTCSRRFVIHAACQAFHDVNLLKPLDFYLFFSLKTDHLVTMMTYSVTTVKQIGQVCSYKREDSLGLLAG